MKKKSVAVIRCSGSAAIIQSALEGQSGPDCAAIKTSVKAISPEGIPRACAFGCLGGGSCAAACPLKAITLKEKGPASVDQEKCVGCGKCVKICPQQLISSGCIGCGICEKACPAGAIRVEDQHAVIDQERCIACGMCASKCPRGVIHDANGIFSIR